MTADGRELPRRYNAAEAFIDRHLREGRGDQLALIDAGGRYSYAELSARVNRAGNMLRALGVVAEQRVLLCLLDTVHFPALFWGAVKIGAVPVPVNTLLTADDYRHMLSDSRARALIVDAPLYPKFAPLLAESDCQTKTVVATGYAAAQDDGVRAAQINGLPRLETLLDAAAERLDAEPLTPDDAAFWLYTSGSTGAPKGAIHLHRSLLHTAEAYGSGVLDIGASDRVFSAAKLFFAYGLGNAMTFPLHAGASAVLLDQRPTPTSVGEVLKRHQPTLFFGVPTLYAAMLDDADSAASDLKTADDLGGRLRLCVSAGEPLPEATARRWRERFGVDILDGIGSTELLHIFVSNRPGPGGMRYGASGKPVPGYTAKLVDDDDSTLTGVGEVGELAVSGPSAASAYWNQRDKSLRAFRGRWTYTGDKYSVDEDGFYHYRGRTDDMLKVGGQWVSPFDVESALIEHDQVLEAAVVGHADEHQLIKPKAFVVTASGCEPSAELAEELQDFVKQRLAPFKYPRWIEFVDGLPKTATGKIQRFKLR